MTIFELLSRIEELGITLQAVNSGLKVHGPKGRLTPDLIDELRDKKQEVLALLQRRAQRGKGYTSIEPAEKREYYMLSPAQKRLYIIRQMETAQIAYNMPQIFSLWEEIDKKKLEMVFKKIIARHESLRTSFLMVNDEPVQRVHDEPEFEIEYYDLATENTGDRRQRADNRKQETKGRSGTHPSSVIRHLSSEFIRPFDLSQAPLLRVGVIKTAGGENLLMIDMHHIITDGASHSILKREFLSLYNGGGRELPLLRLQYRDYSQWLNQPAQQQKIKEQEKYWLEAFAGELPVLSLPLDYPRPKIQSFEGSLSDFHFSKEESRILKEISSKFDTTLYMTILALLNILLSKLSGQEDIIVGTPIAARRHWDLEPIIGMFVNTLPMRNFPSGAKTFVTFLEEIKIQTLNAYENQEYPFEELVEKISARRDTGRNPVFDVMFSFYAEDERPQFIFGEPADTTAATGKPHNTASHIHRVSRFDLVLHASETPEGIRCALEYCTKLFKPFAIKKFISYFKTLIKAIHRNPDQGLCQSDMLTAAEKQEILGLSRGDSMDITTDKPLHQLFEEKAVTREGKIALAQDDGNFSYEVLNHSVNQLAGVLKTRGVTRDSVVAIMMDRSLEMITALLAVIKAGGAYLPIDRQYPLGRIKYMIEDSRVSLLLTREKVLDGLSITSLKNIHVDAGEIKPVVTPRRSPVKDFNALPFPNRTLVDYQKYHKSIGIAMAKHTVSIQATRGCPFNCAFCHEIWPKKHITRSAENIYDEIQYCYQAGVKRFVFIDDVFNLDTYNSGRLLKKIINSRMDVQLFFPNGLRGDILTRDFIDLMVEAGTVNIDLALESASPRIQKLIGKNLNLEKFKENVSYITREYPRVLLEIELMTGFPTETEEEASMTLEFLKDLKWVHFPNLNILKIYPNTNMYRIALEKGVSKEKIEQSANLAYHELPATLPFSRAFVKNLQARFVKEYFLSKERLLHVLPYQAQQFTEEEIVRKYDSYLPAEINRFNDILQLAGISMKEFDNLKFLPPDYRAAPNFCENIKAYFPTGKKAGNAFRILLVDTSLLFTSQSKDMLYDMVEEPLGLMYLMSYLEERFGERVLGKVIKSRIDFDGYEELQHIIAEFKPDLIGLRTLTYYRDFLHAVVLRIRQWWADVPIIVGGPYSSSDYRMLLQDINIDLAVVGEGELTLAELVEKMIENNNKLPGENVLKKINGIAFVEQQYKKPGKTPGLDILLLDRPDKIEPAAITPSFPGKLQTLDQMNDLVYVIYTSGSTGKPKGAMLEHRNLANLLLWSFKFTNLDFSSVLQFASISFDISFQEIFSTLLSGGKLTLIREEMRSDIPGLFEIIQKNRINTVFFPMSILRAIFSDKDYVERFPAGVTHIVTAGEQVVINPAFSNYLQSHKVYLHNHYGPAETHVVTAFTMAPGDAPPLLPPIGKPVSNIGIYILDKYENLQPMGVPGELSISGFQVGRGYLNQPELSAEKFCLRRPGGRFSAKGDRCRLQAQVELSKTSSATKPSLIGPPCHGAPWTPRKNFLLKVPGQRIYRSYRSYKSYIYRSGDLARWLPDGNIEFLGRIDHQVKIRGFRIELGEIETRLVKHEGIKESVVLLKEQDSADKYLCAYVVPRNIKEEIDLTELKDYLASQLPRYMVPDYFVVLEKIPVTPNGKINRKKLLSYKEFRPGLSVSSSAPSTTMEKIVAGIWREVLQSAEVGLEDNFFEIGGNSISILKVHGKLKKTLEIDTPVVKLFKYPTIRSLALYLAEEKKDKNARDSELKLAREITGGKDRLKKIAGDKKTGTGLEIAVIGMSGMFPGAKNLHEFWENLKNGTESIAFFSDGELEEVAMSPRFLEDPDYVKAKGVLEGAEYFDAPFFGYTPREAQVMDAQSRVFHQCVWHALEDAGYDPFAYPGRIGFYAGSSPNIYWEAVTLFSNRGHSLGAFQSMLLRDKDFLCTRISYKLSLKGPSFSVQTACSTSLVAIHLAVQALLSGECEMAMAGGVTVTYPIKTGYIYQEDMIQSPDGHCRAFDIDSGGIVGGNGAGAVVLKPLQAAAADRDHIYAIIKGSAINNDGDRKVGYTAPSVEGQAEVIRAAQYMANIEPETITYVETHGTATELGDPVEIEALKMVFNRNNNHRHSQPIKKSCGIGSLKTNVGHMDCAAGVGGFIKTVLSLKHRLIPPSLHFNTSNPKLGLEDSPFYVVSQLQEWKTNGYLPRAGVSSLGIGGTNAHVVLEEWPAAQSRERSQAGGEVSSPVTSREYQLILLSAKTDTALKKLTQNLTGHISDYPGTNPADLAYTLQVGRQPMQYRKMCVGSNPDEVVRALPASREGVSVQDPPVVFIFSGQGSQYVNMGLEFYRGQPVFRDQMDNGFDILKSLTGKDFKSIFYPQPDSGDMDSIQEQMDDAHNSGPIKFIFEYSLAKLLMSWGVRPYAVMGHSFGEYTAACLSGIFSIEDALKLALLRGELMLRTPPGGMMSVPLSQEQLNRCLQSYPDISLAAVNSSSLCFVSGPSGALERLGKDLQEKDIECMHINFPRAAHSHMMKSITGEFENRVSQIKRHEPIIPFMSCLTGDWASPHQVSDPAYWAKHLVQPVRFCQAVEKLFNEPHCIFIQVGPDKGLPLFINRHGDLEPGTLAINMVKHKKDKITDMAFLLQQLGTLWLGGVKIDWLAFHAGKKRRRISLPTYPFEGKRYWINEKFFNQVMTQQSLPDMGKLEFIEEPQDSSPQARPGPAPGVTPGNNEKNYQAPRNELEQNIARVWQEVLGFEKIGIYDDFFYLNGDSLTATQLLSHIKKMYPVEIGLKNFFVEPTIAHLAKLIKKLMIERIKNLSPQEKERLAGNRAGRGADQHISDRRSVD